MSVRSELLKVWNSFVVEFNKLGAYTYGMTPEAASVLLDAAIDFRKGTKNVGVRSLDTGVPEFALPGQGEKIVHILDEYSQCREFWDVDLNKHQAKITEAGREYVDKYLMPIAQALQCDVTIHV